MPLQNLNKNYGEVPKQNHGKTNKECAEGMQNTTKKLRTLTSICKWIPLYISQYIKQQETANYDKVTATSRGSYFMHADEHTKVFINEIEKTRSIYTKI